LDRLSNANKKDDKTGNDQLHNINLDDRDDLNATTDYEFGDSLPDLKVEVEFLRQQLVERDTKINSLQQQVQEGKRNTGRLQSRLNIFLGGPNNKDDVSAHGKMMRVYKQLQDVEQERDDYRNKSIELAVSLADTKAKVSTLESSLEEYHALVSSSTQGRDWWKRFRRVQRGEQDEDVPVEPAKNTPPQVTFLSVSDENGSAATPDTTEKEVRDATDSKPWSNRSLKSYFLTPERDTNNSPAGTTGGSESTTGGLKKRLGNHLTGLAGGRIASSCRK
jgi:hypothetical protein